MSITREQIKIKESQIEILNHEIKELKAKVFEEEWRLVTREELIELLNDWKRIDVYPNKEDKLNPFSYTNARLSPEGVLKIGGFEYHDHYGRFTHIYIPKKLTRY